MALLSIRSISKKFGGLQALHDVSFDLPEGKILSVIGPNGAGKTTLFNLIAGEGQPDAGDVYLAGERATEDSPERMARRGLARTFQNGRVFGNLTVLENVLIGAHVRLHGFTDVGYNSMASIVTAIRETMHGFVRPRRLRQQEAQLLAEAEEILSMFGDRLLPRLHDPAYTLSYANRRRTELARALALRPRLLLLDEPTAGMNPTETAEMLHILKQLPARNLTILLIEHKIDLVMSLSDHVVALAAGQVLVAGDPASVRADPRLIEAYVGRSQSLIS